MPRAVRRLVALAALSTLAVVAPAVLRAEDAPPPKKASATDRPTPDLARGKKLFEKRCAVCHGEWGEGHGPSAASLERKPRDLATGPYELKSTPKGGPTAADLFRTVTQGIPSSGMPPFGHLPAEERWQIVYYVQSLMGPEAKQAGKPISVPPAPKRTQALVERGKALYAKAGCVQCHGPEGRGQGPAAAHLKDQSGRPIAPHDMEKPWTLKSGRAPEDLYRVIQVGLEGTPMPSYAGRLSPEETWAVVYYLKSLEERR